MSDPHAPSKPLEAVSLHRSDIAGAIAWAAAGAILLAVVVSPGGDPYSVAINIAFLFPGAVVMYWLGLRHGRAIGERRANADSVDGSRFAP
jgi:hypothetical protein